MTRLQTEDLSSDRRRTQRQVDCGRCPWRRRASGATGPYPRPSIVDRAARLYRLRDRSRCRASARLWARLRRASTTRTAVARDRTVAHTLPEHRDTDRGGTGLRPSQRTYGPTRACEASVDTRSLSGEVLVIQLLVLRHHGGRGEIALVALPPGVADSPSHHRVTGHTHKGVTQVLRLA